MYQYWSPKQYDKFERERREPFEDLLKLIHPVHHPKILDLGCGNGILTKLAHEKFHANVTLGIDSSKEMLQKAYSLQTAQLIFEEKDISNMQFVEKYELIISNAALQWLPNHRHLMKQIVALLAPGGQLAIQMPANQDYLTHTIACELANEEPFSSGFNQGCPISHVLSMEEYAQLFDKLGFENQTIRLQLYAHFLESTASVIEWVKGSLLTYYQSYLTPELFSLFLKEYQKRIIDRLGWSEPFFFPMKRLFLWAQLPLH